MDIRDVRKNVVGHDKVGRAFVAPDFVGHRGSKELGVGRHTAFYCQDGHVGRRFDTHDAAPGVDEIAQQVAVVAGQLDYQALWR
jgi:hypothetical protein